MTRPQSAAQQARNKLGGAARRGNPEETEAARAGLRMAVAGERVREIADSAPPLTGGIYVVPRD